MLVFFLRLLRWELIFIDLKVSYFSSDPFSTMHFSHDCFSFPCHTHSNVFYLPFYSGLYFFDLPLSLTHGLFKSVLFSSQEFGNFLSIFCYWVLVSFHCFGEHTLYDFTYFKFVEVCFVPRIWSVLIFVYLCIHNLNGCIFCCWLECSKCWLDPVGYGVVFFYNLANFLSPYSLVLSAVERNVRSPTLRLYSCCFFFVTSFAVWCTYI